MRAAALLISADAFFYSHSEQLAALTVRHAIPAVFTRREFAVPGDLVSYGSDIAEAYRLTDIYAGGILKGDKQADLVQ